ncbi:PPOX class F420-dependent oxidoreductase [soil metagenome]
MPSTIPPDALALFDGVNFAHVATLMPDGNPQVSPVWVERDGDDTVVINTVKGRVKHRNLERDPRVAVSVHAQGDPYSYVQVRGTAELVDEGARDHIDVLSRKYLGKDYPSSQPGEVRVIVRITAKSVDFRPPG